MEKASATDFDKVSKRHIKLSFFWGLVSVVIVYLSSLNSWYAIITLIICIGSIRKYKAGKKIQHTETEIKNFKCPKCKSTDLSYMPVAMWD